MLALGHAPKAIDERLDSIGQMLELLLAERHVNYEAGMHSPRTPTKAILTHHDRDSTATAVNDPYATSSSNAVGPNTNANSEHHVHGNNGAHIRGDGRLPHPSYGARGETTFAGYPRDGEPLGPTVDGRRQ